MCREDLYIEHKLKNSWNYKLNLFVPVTKRKSGVLKEIH